MPSIDDKSLHCPLLMIEVRHSKERITSETSFCVLIPWDILPNIWATRRLIMSTFHPPWGQSLKPSHHGVFVPRECSVGSMAFSGRVTHGGIQGNGNVMSIAIPLLCSYPDSGLSASLFETKASWQLFLRRNTEGEKIEWKKCSKILFDPQQTFKMWKDYLMTCQYIATNATTSLRKC